MQGFWHLSNTINVSTIPSIPDGHMIPTVAPGNHESIQCLLMVQHQFVSIDHCMVNSVVSYPCTKLRFSLCVVAQDNDVEWLYRTITGYGHLLGTKGLGIWRVEYLISTSGPCNFLLSGTLVVMLECWKASEDAFVCQIRWDYSSASPTASRTCSAVTFFVAGLRARIFSRLGFSALTLTSPFLATLLFSASLLATA